MSFILMKASLFGVWGQRWTKATSLSCWEGSALNWTSLLSIEMQPTQQERERERERHVSGYTAVTQWGTPPRNREEAGHPNTNATQHSGEWSCNKHAVFIITPLALFALHLQVHFTLTNPTLGKSEASNPSPPQCLLQPVSAGPLKWWFVYLEMVVGSTEEI